MARYQYRVAGSLDWMSNSGNALLVVSNPAGSGKKLTLRSVEVTNLSHVGTGHADYGLYRATVTGGEEIAFDGLDTDATWPSGCRVVVNAAFTGLSSAYRKVSGFKHLNVAGLDYGLSRFTPRTSWGMAYQSPNADVEGIVVRAGEAIVMRPVTTGAHRVTPMRVTAMVSVLGSPDRTFASTYYARQTANTDNVPFALVNDSGSGQTLVLRRLTFEEVGTYDTPYLQLVPVGSIDPGSIADPIRAVPIFEMDTANPDPSSWVRAYADVPLLPYGMPENALSDGSAGSPKGMNYLKTKDLIGPVYRVQFPERTAISSAAGAVDEFGYSVSHKGADMFGRRAGITIREGEAVALVSAAELATGVTAVPASGWMSLEYGLQIDVEPKISPTLTITGLQNPTEVRIYDAGTTTAVVGQESVTSGTFTWQFDPEEHPSIDIAIISLGYQNLRLLAQPLTLADLTIPVQQVIDRQYANA